MTDRELLELAAKAAGLDLTGAYATVHDRVYVFYRALPDGPPIAWNPLTDDGDALRLTVTLYFTVQVDEEDAKTYVVSDGGLCVAIESHTTDPYAATRRAIVRAAAEIGRNMK